MERLLPNRIIFQWHITEQCNFRCRHCYQKEYDYEGLSLKELIKILEKLEDFVRESFKEGYTNKAHINLTGGEPFLRNDLTDLIDKINESGLFSFGILSNGYFPSEEKIQLLKSQNPKFVQISLEGRRKLNDAIRGKGSYDIIIHALETYRKIGIPVMISFTANSENYLEYPHIVSISRKYKAFKVWTDRYLPNGTKDALQMSTEQFKKLGELIKKETRKEKYFVFSKTKISANRALQFLFTGGKPYTCSAGDSLLAVMPNGDLLPCRRLPIKIGNLVADNLIDLYSDSEILQDIRNNNKPDKKCSTCYYKFSCNGGLKCLSYAMANNYHKKDINCWI